MLLADFQITETKCMCVYGISCANVVNMKSNVHNSLPFTNCSVFNRVPCVNYSLFFFYLPRFVPVKNKCGCRLGVTVTDNVNGVSVDYLIE